jgi:hypothetical protein
LAETNDPAFAPISQRGEPQIVQKLVGHVEVVGLLHLVFGKLVEKPHAFVRRHGQSEGADQKNSRGFSLRFSGYEQDT